MKRFWKKQLPAFLLTLVMMVSLVPAAMAEGENEEPGGETPCTHVNTTTTTTPATCTESGKTVVTCKDCGAVVSETPISKLGHNMSGWEIKTAATCTEDGLQVRSCTNEGCTETETERIPAEHTWGSWKIEKKATCAEEGRRTRTCSKCETTESEPIAKTTDHYDGDLDGNCDLCGTPVNHVHSYKPAKDANKHWEECACGAKRNEGAHYDDNKDGKCDQCGAAVHVHKYPTTWKQSATQHWHECTCGEKQSVGSHSDNNPKDGKCDVCGYQMSTSYTIKFSYLSSSLSMKTTSETVPANASIWSYAPIVSDIKEDGTTYQFKGWASSTSGSKWYIYNGQSLLSSSTKATGGATYYAVYTEDDDSTITYTVDAGKEKAFNAKDFKKLHDNACSDTFEYVTFSVTSSTYNKFTGSVYSGKTELSASDLKSDFYYDEDDVGKNDYALDTLSLVAPKGAKDSSITISFKTYGSKDRTYSGTLKLVVGDDEEGDAIVYEVKPGKTVDFNRTDFNKVYQTEYSGSFSYVVFDKPSSTAFSEGTLYSGYTSSTKYTEKFTRTNLDDAYFYYSGASGSNSYNINTLTFAADDDFEDTVKLTFRVYGSSSSKYVDGTVEIRSTESSSDGDITYDVAPSGKVDFDRADFNKFFQKEYKNYTVSYVEFDKPSASAFSEGTLYHDYGGSSQTSFTRTSLSGTKFYYSPGSKDYDLDELTFKADSDFEDDVTLTFTAYGTGSRSVEGTVVIRSNKKASDSGDITLTVTPGKSVDLDRSKFQSFLREETGDKKATVDYVKFDRPSSASIFLDGALYSNYGKSSQVKFTQTNLGSYTFYYDSKDATGSKEYALDTLTFAADSSFKDSIKLTFTVYGDDDEEEEGTLVIKSDGTAVAATSNYVGSICYATTTNTKVQINADEIARFFSKNVYGTTMQYVTITGVPTNGSLYYNYYNTSKYGSAAKVQLTASNCSSQSYYASPASTAQYALTELTYVPSGTNYCASIPFTAYGGSRSVSGAILISVNGATVAEVYGVTPKNTAVTFPASSISKAVSAASGTTPASIQLLSLPSYTAGAVYVGSGTTTLANTTSAYSIFSGAQSLRFVPSTSYTGNVEIPYVALNSNGTAIATGKFSLGVVSSKKTFTDVKESTWCYKYVAELSSANIISGYSNGSFKPDSTVTYGAALKLVMLAAGYPEQAPTGKNVFSGYLDKARAEGIVTRSNVDLSKPITRLQVAQLAAGAMKLNTSNLSTVQPFTDTTDASVRALNAAGIVGGYFSNGIRTYKPNNTLTRGQAAAIVWRMRNYNK